MTTPDATQFTTFPGGQSLPLAVVFELPSGSITTSSITTAQGIYPSNGGTSEISYYSGGTLYSGPVPTPPAADQAGDIRSNTVVPLSAVITSMMPTSSTAPASGATTSPDSASGSEMAAEAASTASNSPTAPSSDVLSRGAIGGIAVACIIGAALIASLLTWFLMRKRLSHYRNLAAGPGAAGGSYSDPNHPEKGISSSVSPTGGADTGFLAGILPVAADDKEIKQRVNNVFEGAVIHVDNFYENKKIVVPAEVTTQLAQFDSPLLTTSTRDMLAQGMTPKAVITRALTETLASSIDPHASTRHSLLPAAFSALPGSINQKPHDANAEHGSQALFWWRQLSAYLGPSTHDNQTYLVDRNYTIAELTNDFQTAFRPWRKTKYTPQQEIDALVGIFASAADTGVWLFGQRSTFSFAWSRIAPAGEMEVRPALVKTTDANGRALSRPREVLSRQLEWTGQGVL